jgi:hypothetical protein
MLKAHITSYCGKYFSNSSIRFYAALVSYHCTSLRITSWSILLTSSHCHGKATIIHCNYVGDTCNLEDQVVVLMVITK